MFFNRMDRQDLDNLSVEIKKFKTEIIDKQLIVHIDGCINTLKTKSRSRGLFWRMRERGLFWRFRE